MIIYVIITDWAILKTSKRLDKKSDSLIIVLMQKIKIYELNTDQFTFTFISLMRYGSIEQEKGLFTFYKQQQAQEDQIRKMIKKRKKGKSKKQTKQQNIAYEVSRSLAYTKNIESAQVTQPKQLSNFNRFLSRVISKQNSQLMLRQQEKTQKSLILKTGQDEKLSSQRQVTIVAIRKNIQALRGKKNNIFNKSLSKSNEKIEIDNLNYRKVHIQSKMQQLQQSIKTQQALKVKQDTTILQKGKPRQSLPFYQNLKYLRQNNKIALTSERQINRHQVKEKRDQYSQNKRYFQQLITNFYHSHQRDQTGLNNIKQTLKFPHLAKNNKIKRTKTQGGSPILLKQQEMTPIKSFPRYNNQTNRKKLQQRQIERKLKEQSILMNNEDSYVLNFINLSRRHSNQLIESDQRAKAKKNRMSQLSQATYL